MSPVLAQLCEVHHECNKVQERQQSIKTLPQLRAIAHMNPQASQSGASPPAASAAPAQTPPTLEATLTRILSENGHIPHVNVSVHAAAVRELFLHRAASELSAVPRNAPQPLEAENSALEQFAQAPREPANFMETVFFDYIQLETLLRSQTGALEHTRLPRPSRAGTAAPQEAAAAAASAPAAQAPTQGVPAEPASAAPPAAAPSAELRGALAGERADAGPQPPLAPPQTTGRPSVVGLSEAQALQLQLAAAQAQGSLAQVAAAAAAAQDASPSRSQPDSPLETKPTHLLLGTPGSGPAAGQAPAALISPQPGALPGAASQPPLDVFIDDPSLLQRVAEYVPKVVAKELPNPGESSDAGTSEVWRQLKDRDVQGRLAGISPHQGSTTSFTISIPFFNTTLSRVNRLEIAAVVEVLLSLRCCRPRNIEPAVARNLRLDIVTIVKHMAAAPRDSSRLSYTMRTPKAGLHYPDMTIVYKVVLTRIHRWAEQIARRVDKDNLVVRRGGRKRKPSDRGEGGGRGSAGEGGRRQPPARSIQTRGVVLPPGLDGDGDEEEDGDGDDVWGDEGDERASAGGGSGAVARADSDGGGHPAMYGDTSLPQMAAAIAGTYGGAGMDVRRAGSLNRLGTASQAAAQVGAAAAGRSAPGAWTVGPGGGGHAGPRAEPIAAEPVGPGLLPFTEVVHIFQKPQEHLVDFQVMLNSMRGAFTAASAACGLSNSYTGVFARFCRRFATDLSDNKSLECVAVYNGLYECSQAGQHYALLQVVDTYLAE